MNNGQEASKWLARITEDQNLNQLSELENVPYDTLRRLFVSAMLQPGIQFGTYNPDTDKIELGITSPSLLDARSINTYTQISTTSAATSTLTVPAGHAYRVTVAAFSNNNRAPGVQCTYTPNGGSATLITFSFDATGDIATLNYGLGGVSLYTGNSATIGSALNPLWMQAGDTLTLTDTTFVAADVMRFVFVFEDYEV